MKFRKKPIVIEAIQWFPDVDIQGVMYEPIFATETGERMPDVGFIETLEGIMMVSQGDWVIKGIKGELYPCKPDIFDETYEEVD